MHFSGTTLLVFAAIATVQAAGYFSSTCHDWHIRDNTFLDAYQCGDGHGGYKDSELDLNQCIANYGGKLACANPKPGWFGATCSDCIVETGAVLGCVCNGGIALIDLDQCVGNYGGNLGCA